MFSTKRNFKCLHFINDMTVAIICCVITWHIILNFYEFHVYGEKLVPIFKIISVGFIPVYLIMYYVYGVYTSGSDICFLKNFIIICKVNIVGTLLVTLIITIFRKYLYFDMFPRPFFMVFQLLYTLLLTTGKIVVDRLGNFFIMKK